jgi:hypothetical protein
VATSRHGVTWCSCADCGDTVGTVVACQSSCAMSPWSSSSPPSFLGHRIGVGSRPRSSIIRLVCGTDSHDPVHWGRGSCRSGWPLSQGLHHGSHPIVGRIIHASRWFVFGWWVTILIATLCSVVLSMLRGTGMASDWTEVTVVPLVLAGSEHCVFSC